MNSKTNTRQPVAIDFAKPLLIRPDNFTPLARTPWAGGKIAEQYKRNIVPESVGMKIGESWEFSCDPTFPSQLEHYPVSLPELFKTYGDQIFGAGVADNRRQCELLIKLLNAAEPLSLQVHPRDDDPDLKPNECGKPESWYILDVEPGAGIYLGFSRSMTVEDLRTGLLNGRGKQLLQFVPVQAGDYFEIEPGVPHCIGPGVTLLEPQRIVEGMSGKTYRLWDFDRLYDKDGFVDMQNGKPRELHLDAGLKLVDPKRQTGDSWLQTLRRKPVERSLAPGVIASVFPANKWYQTMIVTTEPGSEFRLNIKNGYASLTVLAGQISCGQVEMQQGRTAVLPSAAQPLTLKSDEKSSFAVVCPAYSDLGV